MAAIGLAVTAGAARGAVVTLSGDLGNPANVALVASDMTSPRFTDDFDVANNVALYALHVAVAGTVSFAGTGFPGGGIDPYFSLFRGTDPATATLLDSNYFNAFSIGGDFVNNDLLAVGDYTVAIGVFANMSFAENLGTGFLADGFVGLGSPGALGDGSYTLTITLPDGGGGTVPEPGGGSLVLMALLAAWWPARLRRNCNPKGGRS